MTNESYTVPVFFQNLKGYDARIVLQYIMRQYAPNSINVISNSSKTFISFQLGNLRFVNSLQFLTASLDVLVKYISPTDVTSFFIRRDITPTLISSFQRFFTFMNLYIDGPGKFLLTELPPVDAFYSALTESWISTAEYERAQKVWQEFGIKNMREYHDLYLNLDVLLLTDIFENFRKTCIADYGLDPCRYYILPGFTVDACLKFTDQELDLFIENAIRGGISVVSHRHVKANNPSSLTMTPTSHTYYQLFGPE